MAAIEAVEFIKNDHGDKVPMSGFRKDFAEDKPYKSILQRQGKKLDEVLKMFDWNPDCNRWVGEYNKNNKNNKDTPDNLKLIRYRRRVCFCIGGWREFKEDFGRGDVSCMRDMRVPLVTSRSPLKAMKDEFNE